MILWLKDRNIRIEKYKKYKYLTFWIMIKYTLNTLINNFEYFFMKIYDFA